MMIHSIRCVCSSATLAVVWMTAFSATAQSPRPSNASYSRGVDAYYAGRVAESEMLLGQAGAETPDDPRPHYFRALSLLRSGRGDEARAEMMIGSQLEAQHPGRYPVGKSLERVQGSDRL